MLRKLLLIELLCLAFLLMEMESAYSFPRSNSEDEDLTSQQQQQQTLDGESLDEIVKQLKKGKVEKLQEEEEDPCLHEKRVGKCKAAIPRIFFNKEEGKCQTFIFGGCERDATPNNFKSVEECQRVCAKHLIITNKNTMRNTMKIQEEPEGDASSICALPKDPGSCYALIPRYFFHRKNNRCEPFSFGGCGGNKNNFLSGEECRRTCGGDEASENAICSDVECPWELYTHYTTLGCKPIYDEQACCPTRFECPDKTQQTLNNTLGESWGEEGGGGGVAPLVPSKPKCQYQGKFYNAGEPVKEADSEGSCRAACLCRADSLGEGKIICASVECPENLGGGPGRNCVPLYRKGACCAHDYYCPNRTDTLVIIERGQKPIQHQEDPPVFKCEVDGTSYVEGQRFFPKDQKCLRCVCQKGFDGTLSSEFCEPIDCGIEIYYSDYLAKGCAPVYFQSSKDGTPSCCPYAWECPEVEDLSTPPPPPTTSTNNTREVGTVPETTTAQEILQNPNPHDDNPTIITPATEPPLQVPTTSTIEIFIPPPTDEEVQEEDKEEENLLLKLQVHEDACNLPKSSGHCKGKRPRFYYNKDENQCQQFTYTGCGGNANNFMEKHDCLKLCVNSSSSSKLFQGRLGQSSDLDGDIPQRRGGNSSSSKPRAIYVSQVDPCTLPKETGHCRGYFPRYFYSPESNECELFIYGGCRGNPNNFHTKQACKATCIQQEVLSIIKESSVTLTSSQKNPNKEVVKVPEKAVVVGGDGSTVQFGGPEPVNFTICHLPKRTGPCKAFVKRYYFDLEEGRCKDFVYGGCRPSLNNFRTIEACQNKCEEERVKGTYDVTGSNDQDNHVVVVKIERVRPIFSNFVEKCHLPMKSGSCLALIPSYYYDVETNTCKSFIYSGCFGNGNRFSSLRDCEEECRSGVEVDTPSHPGRGLGLIRMMGLPWRKKDKPKKNFRGNGRETLREPLGRTLLPHPSPLPKPEEELPTAEEAAEICKLPQVNGSCTAHILRFYWNPDVKQCMPFVYSGCDKNKNNFRNENDCLTTCGDKPTIENLIDNGVLSCTFGNETYPSGSRIMKNDGGEKSSWTSLSDTDTPPCGTTVCECMTPPSLTCFQSGCPPPPPVVQGEVLGDPNSQNPLLGEMKPPCPVPSCGSHCVEALGPNGCPTCDCDESKSQFQVEEIFVKE